MKHNSFPIPRTDECINLLGEAAVFPTSDGSSGYWQSKAEDNDNDKTAFTPHHGRGRFVKLPFGLCNALEMFQRTMDLILFIALK